MSRRAVCDVSGGYDSAAALLEAFERGYTVAGLFVSYGQEYETEERSAAEYVAGWAAEVWDARWLGLRGFHASLALTLRGADGVPVECVPQRNLAICALGANLAQSVGAEVVFNGSKTRERRADDPYSFADSCTAFYDAVSVVVATGTEEGVVAPRFEQALVGASVSTKAAVLARLHNAGLDLARLWNCYHPAPGSRPCFVCYHCELTQRALVEAGLRTHAEYRTWWRL